MKTSNIFAKIWVHNMEVDRMIDFLNNKVDSAPKYYISQIDVPESITGGWVELSIPFIKYKKLTTSSSNIDFLTNL
jgi:hypothetical protein|tara:strand:+ start:3434 stop:3661 length:228 start_codon:yes stop_codon:yes gene_type:complete